MAHTKTPWRLEGTSIVNDEVCIAVIEDDGGYEAPERDENGPFIVKAANHHDNLVALLEEIAKHTDPENENIRGVGSDTVHSLVIKMLAEIKRD